MSVIRTLTFRSTAFIDKNNLRKHELCESLQNRLEIRNGRHEMTHSEETTFLPSFKELLAGIETPTHEAAVMVDIWEGKVLKQSKKWRIWIGNVQN